MMNASLDQATTLTALEMAAAEAIGGAFPAGRDALMNQLTTATVVKREFKGFGFYT